MTLPARQVRPSLLHIDAILLRLKGEQALTEVCRFLRSEFSHFDWVGVYRLEGPELVLGGWDGSQPTEHVRIPIDRGLCGRAVRDGVSVVVADVRESPEYLACFLDTRSEIVVPVRAAGQIVGEIDVDGRTVGAFDDSDRRFLEEVARRISGAIGPVAAPAPP
ncbi:MAG: GAF domain-containing protein [Thermoplasmata archaeon]|nr:GAF domain-containing protein [Thermoplasmata archaeon]